MTKEQRIALAFKALKGTVIGAIVGGITIMASPTECVPKEWVTVVEDVETSVFRR